MKYKSPHSPAIFLMTIFYRRAPPQLDPTLTSATFVVFVKGTVVRILLLVKCVLKPRISWGFFCRRQNQTN